MKVLVCAFSCLKDPDRRFGFGEGGEGILGWNLVLQLGKFHETYVLTHTSNKEAIEKRLPPEFYNKINFCYINLSPLLNFTKKRIQVYAYLWQIKAYFIAKGLHKNNHFDVFHHITYANDWMASFIGALLPIPYIRGPGGGAHRVPREFVKEYSLKEKLTQEIRSIGQWFFRHDPFFIISQNRARAILVCNQEAFDALPENWRAKAYFFPVNGISPEDLSLFESMQKRANESFVILSAGKLIKIKAFDLAIRTFKIFSDEVKKTKLIIIGEGPEHENLKKLVNKSNLEGKVIFQGWVSREKLLQEMLDCGVFLFPSLRDGGGNVVVEAMAAGKPVICLDAAGPGFHIKNEWGMKIKPSNPNQVIREMAESLKKLYYDEHLRIKMGVKAHQRAKEYYLWDRLGERLQEIYQEVLNK